MSTNQPMVIDFHPCGAVEAMHREDVLPLGFLGEMSITRASDIRFDASTQRWAIWLADGNGGYYPPIEKAQGFTTYETARNVEVAWLEKCRWFDIVPTTTAAEVILDAVLAGDDLIAATPQPAAPVKKKRESGWNSGDLMAAMLRDGAGS